jgi:hypothetical protein
VFPQLRKHLIEPLTFYYFCVCAWEKVKILSFFIIQNSWIFNFILSFFLSKALKPILQELAVHILGVPGLSEGSLKLDSLCGHDLSVFNGIFSYKRSRTYHRGLTWAQVYFERTFGPKVMQLPSIPSFLRFITCSEQNKMGMSVKEEFAGNALPNFLNVILPWA